MLWPTEYAKIISMATLNAVLIIDCSSLIVFYFFSQKPILKKVSKYENKFAKLQKKAAEFNFRNQLKMVKKPDFVLKDDEVRLFLKTQSKT